MTTDFPAANDALPNKEAIATKTERSKYLLFHEAMCWIAFDQYDFPPIGPRDYFEFMFDDTFWGDEGSMDRAKYELAEQQLIAAIENGLISLLGGNKQVGEITHSPAIQNSESVEMQMHQISHDAVAASDFYEDDGVYYVANRWYDRLIVPVNELEAAFSAFIRRAKSPENLLPVVTNSPQDDSKAKLFSQKRRGRPPEWDWDALKVEIIALANSPDGLPYKQADLESWTAEYFQRKNGREPSVSSIRSKLSPIYERLRQKGQ
jgi:hypothetical protein